jgi:hypothetical protein
MIILFYVVMLCGAAYFLYKKRVFDVFSVAFFSCMIYFAPGFVGVSRYFVGGNWIDSDIIPEAYLVMIAVVVLLLFFAVLYDASHFGRAPKLADIGPHTHRRQLELFYLVVLAYLGLIALWITAGDYLWLPKSDMMEGLNRWQIVMSNAAVIGFSWAAITRKKFYLLAFGAILVFELYIGFRVSAVIAAINIFVLAVNARGRIRLISDGRRYLIIGLACTCLFIVYKGYIGNIKEGNYGYIVDNQMNLEMLTATFTNAEPFVTTNNLNQILISEYKTDPSSFLESVLAGIVPLSPAFGIRSSNSNFQTVLFADVDYGLAANIWGEMWSAGGWILLILFIVVFNLGLFFGNVLMSTARGLPLMVSTTMLVVWAFYIHRNTIEYQLVMERRLMFVLAVGAVARVGRKQFASVSGTSASTMTPLRRD